MCLLLLFSAEARMALGQTGTSSVFPANPTYVDAVTGIVTIPAVAGQAPVTGMIDYAIDGGPVATATVSTGNNYVNLGQLSIGSHVLTFQAHPGSPSASPIVPPHPVSIPVTDQSFGFVGVYGRFHSNYTDANLVSSAGLAIDSKDTVWIADSILSKLVSFDIFGNINNVAIGSLPIPIASPAGLAFDSSDNLFISDRGNSRIVKYTPAGVESVLPTPGLGKPGQLMVDKVKNLLYIVDQDNERVVRYDLSAMALAGYPFTGLTAIQSIALDPAGNVYVSDNVARFLKNVNGVVSALPVNAPIAEAGGIYVDRAGLLYLTDSSINGTYRIDAQGHQTQISDFDSSHAVAEDSRGRIYFGTSTNVRVFTPAGELGVVAATTSSFSNTDQNNSLVYSMPHGQTTLTQVVSPTPPFFYDRETVSCPYIEIHGTCSFQVNFAPQVPGVHTGSIATTLPGGPTITTLLYGNATGAAPAFSPGTQTQTSSGAVLGKAVALDEAGNYYVSDATGNQVYETSGGVTRSLGFTGLSFPTTLAVDGAGAVYVLDRGNNRIAKLDRAGSQTYPVIAGTGNSLSSIDSFAMDGGGQIYFAGPAARGTAIYLYDRTGATSEIFSGLIESAGLALDPYGDIYSLQVDGSLLRIDFSDKHSTLVSAGTFHGHTALAVDASETAYVAQDGVAAVTLVHPNGTAETIPVPGLNHVGGIAVNGTGSILAVDSATNQYTFVDRTHQDLNFGDVPVNTSKTFNSFFGNAGTQPFNITGLPGDSDFQQVTSADACSISGANATVAPASSCNLSYTVAPTAVGAITAYGGVSTNVSQDSDTFTVNAVRAPVAPTFLPASVNFGNVNVGATATQTLALTNSDTAPLTLASVSVTGSFSITGASTCKQNGTIAVGGSCSFTVQFAPTAAGMASGALTVQYTGGSATATLSGTGVAAPTATLTPASYDFGKVTVGASSGPVNFQLTNTSSVSVTISDVSVMGSGFHFLGKAVILAPGDSTTFEVAFLPTSIGAVTGTLNAVTSAGTLITTLTGTGVAPTATLTPASNDFGSVTVGATSNQLLLKFTNTGQTTLHPGNATSTLRGLQFPATAATTCTGSSGSTVVTLAPGASCNLVIDFAPTTAGTQTGVVSIPSEAGNTIATIAGTGVAPTATLTPVTHNFGSVTVGGKSSQLVLKLTNTSNVSLHLTGSLSSSPAFALLKTATTCVDTTVLAPGGTCDLPVDFSPTAVGTVTGTITIGGDAGIKTATLTGTGIAPTATLTPASYDFGGVTVGTTSSQVLLKFTNTSTIPLHPGNATGTVRDLHFPNTAATTCTGSSGSAFVTLAPGASCILAIDFAPTTAGTQTGTVSIPSEAGNTIANITGTGVAPTATLTPATYNFGSVTIETASSQFVLKLTNTSNASLHLTGPLSSSPAFVLLKTATTCTDTTVLAPGGTCDLPVDFSPTSVGTVTGTITIGSEAGTKTATLTGTGVAPTPPPTVSPAALSFGNVTVGATSAAQTVTLTNPATFPLTLTSIGLNGSGFSIQSAGTTCKTGPAIAAGASCTLSVIFSPAVAGAVSGSLTIGLPPGLAVSSLTIPLTGTGVADVVSPEDIDFTNGFTSSGLTLNGAAAVSGGVLQLTANQPSQASAAFYPIPVSTANFSTDFAFQLLDPLAEGITFTIQSDGPTAIGSNDGGLGYQGIAKSIALKFDLRDTDGEGVDSTGIYVDGAPPTVPATSLAASGIDLHSGDVFALHLSYDGTTESISLMDTVTGAVWTTQAAENIPSIVGSSQAYFGFTASTGATSASSPSIQPAAMATSTSVGTTANIIYWAYAARSDGVAALEPIQLNFGNVTVGSTSSVQTANLTNTGTAQFQVTSITPSDPAIIVHSSYCARPVTPGNYCKLEVTVAPTASGPFTGSVAINYHLGDGSTPSQNFTSTLKITSIGIAPLLSLTPSSYDFGTVAAGKTPSTTLTLKNSGNAPAAVTVSFFEKVSNNPSNPFSSFSETSNCPATLGVGASCGIVVIFTPVAGTENTATVSVNAPAATTVSATLSGAGAPPTLSVTPASLDFGRVTVGSSVSKVITLTNTSDVPISITRETGSGDYGILVPGAIVPVFNSAVYDRANFACAGPEPIAPGSSCTIIVTFTPPAAANYSGSFTLFDNAGSQTVTFTGNGVLPTLTVRPATIDFGEVAVGSVANGTVTLTNTSSAPINFSKEVDSGDYGSVGTGAIAATLNGNCAAQPLTPGASCTFIVTFTPRAAVEYSGSFTDFDDAGSQTVTFLGHGVPPNLTATPSLTVTPARIDFGPVAVGSYVDRPVTYTNTSDVPITLSGQSVSGSFESPISPIFTGTFYNCWQLVIAPGASCTELVEFAPQAATNYSGGFTQFDNAGSQTVTITGAGVASSSSKSSIDFAGGFPPEALILNGTATVVGETLQLTAGASSAASSAFFPASASTTSFTTDFTFQLLDPTAEGITFTVQGDGPSAVGLGGGGLGYQGLAKSIAVKFDLKDTAGEGADSTGIYLDGAAPTVPATSLASSGIDLHSGDIFALHITYDGTTEFISLTDTVTKAVWTTQAAENIPGIVGGNIAYFGFTAGSVTPTFGSHAVGLESSGSLQPNLTARPATQPAATSTILTWTVADGVVKTAQTVIFPPLPPQTYGTAPIRLAATSTSGLPVGYTINGPAKLSGSTLTITGAGEVSVTATQPGNASFMVAPRVTRSFAVAKAPLTVIANSVSRAFGASNPAFSYELSGFVNGDTATVVGGIAVLATTTAPASPAGKYPITFTGEGLTAANYSFVYAAGTLTVTPGTLVIAPSSGNFGSIAVGMTSPAISFTVTNNTASTMGYLGYSNLGEFYLRPATCHLVNGEPMLRPGQSCIFTAVFKPTKPGPVSGDLSIQTSSGTFNVPMTGTGSTLVISPPSGNFGIIAVGKTSAVISFTVTNDTTSTMGYLGYSNLGEFYPQPGTCHLVNGEPMLNPGKSCVFTAVFRPTKAGTVSGDLSIQTSSGNFNVPMTGTGVAP